MNIAEYNQQSDNDDCLNISATGIIFSAYTGCLLFNIYVSLLLTVFPKRVLEKEKQQIK